MAYFNNVLSGIEKADLELEPSLVHKCTFLNIQKQGKHY